MELDLRVQKFLGESGVVKSKRVDPSSIESARLFIECLDRELPSPRVSLNGRHLECRWMSSRGNMCLCKIVFVSAYLEFELFQDRISGNVCRRGFKEFAKKVVKALVGD